MSKALKLASRKQDDSLDLEMTKLAVKKAGKNFKRVRITNLQDQLEDLESNIFTLEASLNKDGADVEEVVHDIAEAKLKIEFLEKKISINKEVYEEYFK